jgi:PAS domain S-box-containing protein
MTSARIMIVEDENVVALDIQSRVESLGYSVVATVRSGEKAIEKVAQTRPDLVLMDIRLKGALDGIQAAGHIHARFDIPVIYLTAYADQETLQRAQVTEPYGYILKPFEVRELHSSIEMALYKHETEKKLKENERWLGAILKSIGDAVMVTDERGQIKFMNPVAEVLTGWRQSEAKGQDPGAVFRIIHEETRWPVDSPIMQALRGGQAVNLPGGTLLISRDGREIPIDDSVAPVRDEKGRITGCVLVFRDITERKRAEENLRRYAAELEARNRELDAFAHTVAHDLKNPAGIVVGFSQVLQDGHTTMSDSQRLEIAQALSRTGHKMNSIIDELLLLAELRDAQVETGPLDMRRVVAEAQQSLEHTILKAGAELVMVRPEAWPKAVGYAPWLEQVWVNYISNALKYGGAPPRVELGATEQLDGRVRFWVRDYGPGLTPEQQAHLFAPFAQLQHVRPKGHGLGLSIVRRIMEKLGGHAGVESKGVSGQGSMFYFTLPAAIEADMNVQQERVLCAHL